MFTVGKHHFPANRGARAIVAASGALLLFLVAGCSSSGGSSTEGPSDSAAAAQAVDAAQARLKPYLSKNDDLEVDIPLTRAPEKGKRVSLLYPNIPAGEVFASPFPDAAAALGWELDRSPFDSTDPQGMTNGIIRAVSEKYDFIVAQGANAETIGPGLAAAKKAGIQVFLAGGYGDVNEEKGIYGNSFQKDVLSSNLALLDKMIVDSGGNGSVLLVNAPDFPPLKPVGAAAQERIGKECPECSITLLGISAADLSGDIASNIVATVRQNPEIKYVVAAFTDLSRGLPQALKAAGLDDVKVYVVQPDDATVHLIEKGDIDAGALPPKRTFGWATVDMMARYSVGMPVLQDEVGEFNLWIWTPETMPKGQTSWDPTDYQERYKKLWQVS